MNRVLSFTILYVFFFAFVTQIKAQERQLFDGGMMIHTGYLHSNIDAIDYTAKGMTFGIGGTLRFHIGKHFRIGGEGYFSTLQQLSNGSYSRTNWGGILADIYWRLGRWQPYIGFTTGGGTTSMLLMFNGSTKDWHPEKEVLLHNEKFFLINPMAGVEFALNNAIHLTFKTDWLIPLPYANTPTGMRFYIGFIFAH